MTRYFVLAAAVVAVVGNAEAGSVTYKLTESGSGYLGTSSFTDDLVTLTAIAVTDNITGNGDFFFVPAASMTVDVAGIGTATITLPTGVYSYLGYPPPNAPQVVFAFEPDGPNGGFTTIMAFLNSAFESYNLATSFGPLTGPDNGGLIALGIGTSLGSFGFTNSQGTDTFQATVVPEPSSLVGAGTGILMLAGYVWRRRKRSRPR